MNEQQPNWQQSIESILKETVKENKKRRRWGVFFTSTASMVPDPLIPLSCLAHVDRTKAAIPRITTAATFRIHIDLARNIIIDLAPHIGFSSHCATHATRIGSPAVFAAEKLIPGLLRQDASI